MDDQDSASRTPSVTPDSAARVVEPNRQRNRGAGAGRRTVRPPDVGEERRPPRRSNYDRGAVTGYGDGVERAHCAQMLRFTPPTDVISHRTGCATIPPGVVAQRLDSWLLCDLGHDGPHVWPDGETVGEDQQESASPLL